MRSLVCHWTKLVRASEKIPTLTVRCLLPSFWWKRSYGANKYEGGKKWSSFGRRLKNSLDTELVLFLIIRLYSWIEPLSYIGRTPEKNVAIECYKYLHLHSKISLSKKIPDSFSKGVSEGSSNLDEMECTFGHEFARKAFYCRTS